nr:putative membrane protein [Cedratvirus lena]
MNSKLGTFIGLSFTIFVTSFTLGFYRGQGSEAFDLVASFLLPACFLLQTMILLF